MKRYLFLLMMILMLIPGRFCAAQDLSDDIQTEVSEDTEDSYDYLIVANTTAMRGDFFTNMWGNDTADIDVRTLIDGYNLVMWDGAEGKFSMDPTVVRDLTVLENEAGDRSYIITLYDDLYYSDGTKITSKDYAFSFLLHIAPEIDAIGGTSLKKSYLYGYADYITGAAASLAGVRILNDQTLMVTVDHDSLPFFYELGLLWCYPYPIHVIAQGVEVRDDGNGVLLANIDDSVTEPIFTAELLEQTINDPETGYRSHPSVSCGPYVLSTWDGRSAQFVRNPYYIGDPKGDRPQIEWLTYTLADNNDMIEKLENGEYGLLNKVTKAGTIMEGMQLLGSGGFAMSNYPRIGLSYISFKMERPTVASQAVRQAIAWCMDRDQIIQDYVSSFGIRVDSYYGVGQWMYGIVAGTTAYPLDPPEDENDAQAQAEYEEELERWEALSLENLIDYEADVDEAIALLTRDGWTLNADRIREKVIDGETVTLDLKMIYPEGNEIIESFEENMVPYLEEAGIRLTMEAVPMPQLLSIFYHHEEYDADMIYMASNFDEIFDPSAHFQTDAEGNHSWSFTRGVDEDLYETSLAMIRTEPGDALEYVECWIAFLEHFNEALPMIPLYSNVYFDMYTTELHDYVIEENVTWGQAIVGAYLGPVEEEPSDDEEFDEFGDEEFGDFIEFDDDDLFEFDD